MTNKLLPNKTIPSPIGLAVHMLCLNLALLEQGNGSKIEVVKPINTGSSWQLKSLVDALDQLVDEKLHTAHSAPPGYYDNLYGFRQGYDPGQSNRGPAFIRDRAYKNDKDVYPNKPLFGSGYFPPNYMHKRIDRPSCCGRFQTPQDHKHHMYYRGFYEPQQQNRYHYPYQFTRTSNHYQDFIYKSRAAVPYNNHGHNYAPGPHPHYNGFNGASIYSNLLIPSYRNKYFVPSSEKKRTGVYLVPTPQKYYVDNVAKNKTTTATTKPMDISTLVLSLNNMATPKSEIQLENVKRKTK